MDWEKVEAITGHKILYASLVGSRRFGLERGLEADYDYAVYVKPDENSAYDPNGAYTLANAGEGDIYFLDIAHLNNMAGCASIYTVESYGSVQYARKPLCDFLYERCRELENLSPRHTYFTFLDIAQRHLATGSSSTIARTVRDAGVLYRYFQIEDMSKSFDIQEPFLSLYRVLHSDPHRYSAAEVQVMLHCVYTNTFRKFFSMQKTNLVLFQEFQEVLRCSI